MRIAGDAVLHAPVAQVWEALLDPRVLVATIPGCERLEATGENAYAMTVTAGVAAIKGTYAGSCDLSDLIPHESLVMKVEGAGAPGTIGATVNVRFTDAGGGTTRLEYDADAIVGGMIGGVGQRMLTSVSKRMAGEFFGNVDGVLTGTTAGTTTPTTAGATNGTPGRTSGSTASADAAPTTGQVFTAPPKAAGALDEQSFLKGVALGAGLVLAGVFAGALLGRRRR